jgi:hypothetical protein
MWLFNSGRMESCLGDLVPGIASNPAVETDIPSSAQTRVKLEGSPYLTDNVRDFAGWELDAATVSNGIKYFYDKTGVVPILYFKEYDNALAADRQKQEWAEDYFDEYIDDPFVFLYVYFNDRDDDGEGYMGLVNWLEAEKIMDEEATEIFWAILEKYWWQDIENEDVFIKTFRELADKIMD